MITLVLEVLNNTIEKNSYLLAKEEAQKVQNQIQDSSVHAIKFHTIVNDKSVEKIFNKRSIISINFK